MKNDSGGFLLSHTLPGAVPSAFTGLASRFGMGFWAFPRGYDHRKNISQPAKHPGINQNGLPAVFAAHTLTFGGCVGLVVVCIVVTSKQCFCLSCCLVVLVVDY